MKNMFQNIFFPRKPLRKPLHKSALAMALLELFFNAIFVW